MKTNIFLAGLASLALAALLATGFAALAETVSFKAALNGQSEVPPTTSEGTGSLIASYDTTTKTLTWTLEYSGLTGAATAAHFHGPATATANAGVVVLIGNNPTSPAKGTATLTDTQAADLTAGM